MMQCPQCGQTFSDEYLYCLDDGSPLTVGYSSSSGDVPTQVISRPVPISESRSGPPWLYALLGVLATACVAIAIFAFWPRETERTTQPATPMPTPMVGKARTPEQNILVEKNPVPSNTIPTQPVETGAIEREIQTRLAKWAADGESRSAGDVVTNYTGTVTYYRRRNADRTFIARDKSRAYNRYRSIDITLDNITISVDPSGTTARAILDKAWLFTGGGYSKGKVRQEIRLVNIAGEWLINGERDIHIY